MSKVEHKSITDTINPKQEGIGSIINRLFKWADLNWKGLSITWGVAFFSVFLVYKVYAEPHIDRSKANERRLDTLEYDLSLVAHNQKTMFTIMEKVYGKELVDAARQETDKFKPKKQKKKSENEKEKQNQ